MLVLKKILKESGSKHIAMGPGRHYKNDRVPDNALLPWRPEKNGQLKWKILKWTGIATIWGFVAIALFILFIFLRMPSLDQLLNETRMPSATFVDRDGYEIRALNRLVGAQVSTKNVPPYVWQSIVAIEDRRFFDHGALDLSGIARSVLKNMHAGRVVQGGSSLTQQLAKNVFLSSSKTVTRKVQEMILSFWLESRFSKDQILNLYMNRISLVKGMRGLDAAARDLYAVPAADLTLAQSAQLAAMLKAPTTYNPIRNPEKSLGRTKIVLRAMYDQKYITLDQMNNAIADAAKPIPVRNDENIFRYFTDYVWDDVLSRLGDQPDSDLIIYTTLDSRQQQKTAGVVRSNVLKNNDKSVGQGAAVIMDKSGAILTMVGGIDYQASQFNRVSQAPRQPGSAFKPVVYLVALEHGMTPETYVNDSHITVGKYSPKNYNDKYYGDIPLKTAFAKSVNSVPIKLTREYGISSVLSMASRLGVGTTLKREFSTVLGASEMTLLDLTTMYAVIANDGHSVIPYAVTSIVTDSGETLYERIPSESLQILQQNTVSEIQELLAETVAVGGTGHRAYVDGITRGGKTGTSSENRDAWFIGYTDNLIMGIWVGNDNFTPMSNKITGGVTPAEIFHDTMLPNNSN